MIPQTAQEREDFCAWMAALLSPPDGETLARLPAEVFPSPAGAAGGDFEAFCRELEKEYDRLFGRPGGGPVSLVESTYKPWTGDEECRLSFAREKGLFMGDSALHMAALFRHSGVEVPGEFRACPDHLSLELEFLSALYGGATDREVRQFIRGHLDWVPELKENLLRLQPHPFYRRAVEGLDIFLDRERERLEITDDGKKSVH